jgi:hypothetical protein
MNPWDVLAWMLVVLVGVGVLLLGVLLLSALVVAFRDGKRSAEEAPVSSQDFPRAVSQAPGGQSSPIRLRCEYSSCENAAEWTNEQGFRCTLHRYSLVP